MIRSEPHWVRGSRRSQPAGGRERGDHLRGVLWGDAEEDQGCGPGDLLQASLQGLLQRHQWLCPCRGVKVCPQQSHGKGGLNIFADMISMIKTQLALYQISEEEIEAMILKVDKNGDGKISYSEFRVMLGAIPLLIMDWNYLSHFLQIKSQKKTEEKCCPQLKWSRQAGGCFVPALTVLDKNNLHYNWFVNTLLCWGYLFNIIIISWPYLHS